MLIRIQKILRLFVFLTGMALSANAQKTFSAKEGLSDSLNFGKYKIYLVSKEFQIEFIGRRINLDKRFTLNKSQISFTESAIKSQYFDANVRALDSQWQQMQNHKEDYDWELAVKQNKENRPKLEAAFRKQQQQDLDNYDRYLFGFINELGDKVVLIRFDPHIIKYFSVGGELHISNLSPMMYNLNTRILYLAGWE